MVSVDKAVIARIEKGKDRFEILVDPDKALDFKRARLGSMENLLAVNNIFSDSKKGEKAATADMARCLGTSDIFKAAEKILLEGELQLTTEQRRKLVDEKRKQIVDMIAKQGVNPQTQLPHPPLRIENAMEQAHLHIDPFKPAGEQMKAALEEIQKIIPISLETLEVAVKVPVEHAGKLSSVIRKLATVKKEEWGTQAWFCVIEIPAGMQGDIYSKMNDLAAGNVETKIIKTSKL
jgi:ribosome maturation protein SDO1